MQAIAKSGFCDISLSEQRFIFLVIFPPAL